MVLKHWTSRGEVLAKAEQIRPFRKSYNVTKGVDTIEKAGKPRIGKKYSQQPGRKSGKGTGHIGIANMREYARKISGLTSRGQTIVEVMNKFEITWDKASDIVRSVEKEPVDRFAEQEEEMKHPRSTKYFNDFDKSKRGIPYEQQIGRKRGRGRGHIVPEDKWQHILRDNPFSQEAQTAQGEEDVREALMRHGSVEQEEPIMFDKARLGKPYTQQVGRMRGKGAGKIVDKLEFSKELQYIKHMGKVYKVDIPEYYKLLKQKELKDTKEMQGQYMSELKNRRKALAVKLQGLPQTRANWIKLRRIELTENDYRKQYENK